MNSSTSGQVAPGRNATVICLSRLVFERLVVMASKNDRELLRASGQQQLQVDFAARNPDPVAVISAIKQAYPTVADAMAVEVTFAVLPRSRGGVKARASVQVQRTKLCTRDDGSCVQRAICWMSIFGTAQLSVSRVRSQLRLTTLPARVATPQLIACLANGVALR